MARFEIPKDYTIGLLASMPRSGTWYSFYFFEFLDLFLTGRTELNTRMDLEIYHGLKVGKISVHTICPGFLKFCTGDLREKWNELKFYIDGYNYGYPKFIEPNLSTYSPDTNPDIKIIYLYRNPLDQCVSYFRHAQNNKNHKKRMNPNDPESPAEMKNVSEYMRAAGLESYLKQYFTFKFMAERYEENILMVSFEELQSNPAATFGNMLRFWRVDTEQENVRNEIPRAINASSKDSLRKIEKAIGSSLARDQTLQSESHIRSGIKGKWQEHLNDADLKYVETKLSEFGVSLREFDIGVISF